MKILKFSTLIALFAFALTSCDIIEEPVCLDCQAEASNMKILLEDFTGHQCGNCPRAHEQLEILEETYGENLIVVALHAGGFAATFPAAGYVPDYTTEMGDELLTLYDADNEGLPVGMVNRRTWADGKVLQKFASWGTQISTILAETPQLSIELSAEMSDNETLDVDADLTYFAAGNSDHHLVVIVTEDSIYSKQSDYDLSSGYVSDYHHKHMMRGSITSGNFGEQLTSNTIAIGEIFSREYQFAWNTDWDASNCHIVAYVIDNTTKEIIQAEQVSISE